MRRPQDPPDAEPSHVLLITTLGAPERRRLPSRPRRNAQPEPEVVPVTTGRATIIDVGAPFSNAADAARWLDRAGEAELETHLAVLNRALQVYRLAAADPYQPLVGRRQALVARIGYGAGEQVANGLWSAAVELAPTTPRRRRAQALQSQARLAAVLTGRDRALASEELALRARLDLDQGRVREAALQVRIALDAALAELAREPVAGRLEQRLSELRAVREDVSTAGQAALHGDLSEPQREQVASALARIEAALRARSAAAQ